MKCSEIKELLSAYANDELLLTQKESVEEHLSGCIDCRTTLADYRVIRQQLESLKTLPAMPDIRDTTMSKIKSLKKSRLTTRWMRPSLVAIPIIAIIITLFVLQPWRPLSGPEVVMAKAIAATDSILTYRASSSPFIIISLPDDRAMKLDAEWEFVLPDRIHLKLAFNGHISEYISIGSLNYRWMDNNVTFPFLPTIDVPSKENSLKELKLVTGLEQLPDDSIDGITCFHFKGIDSEGANTTIELWLGKEDYLLRQRISQTIMPDSTIHTSIKKYYDFNQPITIKAPLTSSGELLDGWTVWDTASLSTPGQAPVETGTTTTTSLPYTTTTSP